MSCDPLQPRRHDDPPADPGLSRQITLAEGPAPTERAEGPDRASCLLAKRFRYGRFCREVAASLIAMTATVHGAPESMVAFGKLFPGFPLGYLRCR
jgi:hypothetical protein